MACDVRCLPYDCVRSLDYDFRYFRVVVSGLWRVTFVAFLLTLLDFLSLMSGVWVFDVPYLSFSGLKSCLWTQISCAFLVALCC